MLPFRRPTSYTYFLKVPTFYLYCIHIYATSSYLLPTTLITRVFHLFPATRASITYLWTTHLYYLKTVCILHTYPQPSPPHDSLSLYYIYIYKSYIYIISYVYIIYHIYICIYTSYIVYIYIYLCIYRMYIYIHMIYIYIYVNIIYILYINHILFTYIYIYMIYIQYHRDSIHPHTPPTPHHTTGWLRGLVLLLNQYHGLRRGGIGSRVCMGKTSWVVSIHLLISICPYIYLPIYLSIYLSIYLMYLIYLSIYLIYLSIYLPIYLSIYLIYLSI